MPTGYALPSGAHKRRSRLDRKMSVSTTIAQAIVSAVEPLREAYETKATAIKENDAKVETVKVSDLTVAIEKSDDAEVKKIRAAMAKASEKIAAAQKEFRDARNSAQGMLFPGTVNENALSDEDRKALIAEAAGIRKQIVETYKSALAVDPEFTLPELSPVVGTRGRTAGFVSAGAGKPKPRVSAVSVDGKAVEPKPTFGNALKAIKGTTNVTVESETLVNAFLAALVAAGGTTEWNADSNKGKSVSFDLVVDTETNRSVKIDVTV